jgi:hypothetical protein
MTGYQADLDIDQVGPDTPILRKPFSLSELARVVEDTLNGTSLTRDTTSTRETT